MDKHSYDKSNDNLPQTQEKIPHGGERKDFEELGPLTQNDEPRLIRELEARDTVPAALIDRTKQEDEKYESKPWYKHKALKIGAPVVGAAAAAALVFGLTLPKGDADGEKNVPAPDPDQTTLIDNGETNPQASPTPNEQETQTPSAESYAIPAGLDAEKYADRFVKILDAWGKAGSENIDELADEWLGSSGSQEDFWQSVAQKNAPKFADEIFGEGWKNKPDIKPVADRLIAKMSHANAVYLQLVYMTDSGDPSLDAEVYTRESTFKSVVVENATEASRTLDITYTNTDNSDKNRADNSLSPEGNIKITTAVENGSEVVVSADYPD